MSPSIMEDDVDADYFATSSRPALNISIEAAMEDTEIHPVVPVQVQYGDWLCLASMIVSVLTIIIAGLVVAQVIMLPDATVWPLGVAALICAAAAAVLGWVGVRGRS